MAFVCPFMSGVVAVEDNGERYIKDGTYIQPQRGVVVHANCIEGKCRAWNSFECFCKLIDGRACGGH
jgi:hypothetical protein